MTFPEPHAIITAVVGPRHFVTTDDVSPAQGVGASPQESMESYCAAYRDYLATLVGPPDGIGLSPFEPPITGH